MKCSKSVYSVSLLLTLAVCSAIAQTSFSGSIDSLFSGQDRTDVPATVIGVIQNGQLVYTKFLGKEDLARNIPPNSETNFNLGSNGKQFTAMGILLLQEQGLLSLNDEVHKYIPELQDYGVAITLEQLLHHTSGIRDYLVLWEITCLPKEKLTKNKILTLLCDQEKLNFLPGTYHLYSNSNYFLLGLIAERVSGKPFHVFIRENIFEPLGMNHTFFQEETTTTHEALDYTVKDTTFSLHVNTHTFNLGDGGIISNLNDLCLWDQNFYQNRLGSKKQELIHEMGKTGLLNTGENTFYASGLNVISYRGQKVVLHGGGYHAYNTQWMRFPEHRTSIIYLSARIGSTDPWCFRIANRVLKASLSPDKDPAKSISAASGEDYCGYYYSKIPPDFCVVSKSGNQLIIRGLAYSPLNDSTYSARDDWDMPRSIALLRSGEGQMRLSGKAGGSLVVYVKLKEDSLRPSCWGKYFCPELPGHIFELKRVHHRIVFVIDNHFESDIQKSFGDKCILSSFQALLVFKEGINGKVQGFTLSSDRVKNLWFTRKK